MRGAAFAILMALSAAPAHAQEDDSIHAATARVMIGALAPTSYGDWAYEWGAVSSRVSLHMHWHLYGPEPRERAPDADVRRNGWIDGPSGDVGVSAYGGDARVREIAFRFTRSDEPDALLAALRAAGAEVRAESVTEAASHYTLAPPERDTATLTRRVSCTSPRSAAAQRCWTDYTLLLPERAPAN